MEKWFEPGVAVPVLTIIIIQIFAWYRQWHNNQNSLNRFGERLGDAETRIVRTETRVEETNRSCESNSQEQVNMRERIARNETNIGTLKEELQTERLAVMSKLYENDKNASGRDAIILERLSRLEERFDVTKVFTQMLPVFTHARKEDK